MRYDIVWTDIALQQLNNNVKYLEQHWTITEIDNFLATVKEHEANLSYNPEMYPLSLRYEGYRKCVITKQTTIYYKIESNQVIIHAFWGNRQKPDNLNL